MKISKLKYVLAFVLMVAISVVTTNVNAVTMENRNQIKLSTIIASQLAAIEDGDEPSVSTYENEVYLFNTRYSTQAGPLGGAMNPVYSYAVKNTKTGIYTKAYALGYSALAENKDGVVYTGIGTGRDVDNKIGLGLAFGLNYLSSDQAANQTQNDESIKAASYATQMYIWIANSGLLGTASETSIVNANLSGSALTRYYNIRNSVYQVLANPSYTHTSQAEANAHPIEMNWNPTNGRYEYTVTDTNGLDTMSLVNLVINSKSGIQYSKNGNSVTFYTTEQVGTAAQPVCIEVYKSINNGRWVPGYANTIDSNQSLVYLSGRQNSDTVTYVSFYTNALRIEINKQFAKNPNNDRTGDVKLANAVYGIYADEACTQLVQQVITDANGYAISNPLEDKNYYVKEITAPEGCELDGQVHLAAVSSAQIGANGQRIVKINSTEQVIYGGFRMVVSISDLSGATTKEPAVGSVIKLTLDSNANEYYTAVVDEIGYAEFQDIPYGHYTCTEIQKVKPELDYMDPISIFINSNETFIYSKLINTEVAQRYVKIVKQDAETGKVIPAANTEFVIKDQDGEVVIQEYEYNEGPVTLTSYKTNAEGYLMLPKKLPYGNYTIYEVIAPDGYYNQYSVDGKTPSGRFSVESNTVEDPSKEMVVAVVQNIPQKADLKIYSRGQVLSGTNAEQANGYDVSRPAYTAGSIPGAVYKVIAKEDIVTGDGTVRMKAGESVTLTTDKNGFATTKLYLGAYTIEQVSVPKGYAFEGTQEDILLTYKGQKILTWEETKTYSLVKQDYKINLAKEFKELNFVKQNEDEETTEVVETAKYSEVVIGIYAAEDIKDAAGNIVIPANTRVDAVRMNNDGTAVVNSNLPMGKFYAQELETNQNYVVSDKKYEITATPANNTDKVFTIDVEKIINEAKKLTKLSLTKIEKIEEDESLIGKIESAIKQALMTLAGNLDETVTVTRLEGAEYAVYYKGNGGYYPLLERVGEELVEVVRTSDENGEIIIEGMPFGEYAVKEIKAPRYYELDEKQYAFEFTTAKPEAELVLEDERTLVDLTITVKDEDGNLVKDAIVELVDPTTNRVAYVDSTDKDGVVKFNDIRAGRYIRKVPVLSQEYVVPEDEEIYVEKSEENINVEVEVRFIVGNILVYKTDAETGKPLAGCKFKITNKDTEEVVAEGLTDENGHYEVKDLRFGVYLVEETEAVEGYEKDDTIFEVIVSEDGVTYEVDYTNIATGDIAVALYAVIALISVGVIAKVVKKMKMN